MLEIAAVFGVDWKLLLIQLVNFGLLLFVLNRYVIKPGLRMLEERRILVTKGVEDAHKAQEILSGAESKGKEILEQKHKEADALALLRKQSLDAETERLHKEAEEKRMLLVRQAREEGEKLKSQLLRESEAEIAKMAVIAAEKILRNNHA